jgi:hypothetical protein
MNRILAGQGGLSSLGAMASACRRAVAGPRDSVWSTASST